MEVKPGYKQTEFGVIPEEWEVFALSTLTEPQRPISYGIVQTGPNVPNGVRCLRVLDIHEGRINKAELITTSKQISDSYRRTVLKAGDLVMPLRGKVGDVGLVDEELEGSNLTRGVALIAIRAGWSPVFCQHVISSASTRRRLEQAMNGSALQEIPIASLRSFKIATPQSLPEQRAIAAALSDVDGLLGGLDRLIAKKRDLKQAAMQQLLTGQTRLPGFHGEWEVKRLGDVVQIKKGQLITSSTLKPGDIPVIAGGKQPAYFHASANRFGRTITISASGASAGYVALYNEPIFASDCSTISESEGYFLDFVYYQLLCKQQTIYKAQTGGAQPHIHAKDLNPILFSFPALPEQTAIATVLSEMDGELAVLEQRREKTRALKQAMMQELLTGRTRLV
jgi:type I restriction enzyme S subunit